MGRVTGILVDQFAQAGFRPLASGRIVNVGGSRGTLLAYLLGALPAAHGVLMDRAEALAGAPGFLAEAGVADRVELVVGDFLREVPARRPVRAEPDPAQLGRRARAHHRR